MLLTIFFCVFISSGVFGKDVSPSSSHIKEVSVLNRTDCQPGDIQPLNRVDTSARVSELIQALQERSLDAFLVPSTDAHQSEYIADADRRLLYISGFSGNSGKAAILATDGQRALWSDGRYFIQADEQLDCNWLFMKEEIANYPTMVEWLAHELPSGSVVGADPYLINSDAWVTIEQQLRDLNNIDLVSVLDNPIDEVWASDTANPRPEYSDASLFVHEIQYAGETWQSKLSTIRSFLSSSQLLVLTSLDEVAWLLNLRGADLRYTPLFFSYLFLTQTEVRLFVDQTKVTQEIVNHLTDSSQTITLHDYTQVLNQLQSLANSPSISSVWIPGPYSYAAGASYAIYNAVPEAKRFVSPSPVVDPKSQKNAVEQASMREAHIKDGVAMVEWLALLEAEITSGTQWDELRAQEELYASRARQDLFFDTSFEITSAYGANGAIIHYKSSEVTNVVIGTDSLYLVDSGGQYHDGTTDVSRTMFYGTTPRADMVEMYTRVLMGQIDLATLMFPDGTPDTRTDILARRPLNMIGEDFRHGTGHGVGMFLVVHEAPLQVRVYGTEEHPYKPGHFFSNEPGYYREGDFGIRLENVQLVVETEAFFDDPFYKFEVVTLVPYERKLIDTRLLTAERCAWLDNYHSRVRDTIGPRLLASGNQEAYQWLLTKTEPLCP